MKKILLATSAIVAAGLMAAPAQAEGIELKVGGHMEQWFGYQDNDSAVGDIQDFNQWSDIAIKLEGKAELDNGLTVGAVVTLQGDNEEHGGVRETADEHFAYVAGEFGTFEIGATASAAHKMMVIAPNVGMRINNGDVDRHIEVGKVFDRTTVGGTLIEAAAGDNDQKISYISPMMNGFKVGVSYAPDAAQSSAGNAENTLADIDNSFHDAWTVGFGYTGEMNGVGIDAAGGYYYASEPEALATADAFKGWNFGLNLTMQGLTIGGSYADVDGNDGSDDFDGSAFDLGVAYKQDAWGVSLTYQDGEIDNADELKTIAAGVSYDLGMGIAVKGSLGHADYEDQGGTDENDGMFATAGIALKF